MTARLDRPVLAADDQPELDLDAAGIRSIVWATGYRLDFGWVDLPIFDERGYPRHVRGVTTFYPGLTLSGFPGCIRSHPPPLPASVRTPLTSSSTSCGESCDDTPDGAAA